MVHNSSVMGFLSKGKAAAVVVVVEDTTVFLPSKDLMMMGYKILKNIPVNGCYLVSHQ